MSQFMNIIIKKKLSVMFLVFSVLFVHNTEITAQYMYRKHRITAHHRKHVYTESTAQHRKHEQHNIENTENTETTETKNTAQH